MSLTIRPLTPDLWPALEDVFGKGGACNGCWCMYWRIGSEYHKRAREKNRRAFRDIVKHGRRACWRSTANGPSAGASSRLAMIWAGSLTLDSSNAWTTSPSGRSRASTFGAAIAGRVSCRR
jgi:hypothetical protein